MSAESIAIRQAIIVVVPLIGGGLHKERKIGMGKDKRRRAFRRKAIHEAAWIGSMKRRVKRTAARNSEE